MTVSLAPATPRFVAAEGVRFQLWRSDPPAVGEDAADGRSDGASDGASSSAPPPALLLHGIPQTALCWRELLPELATDRIVLAPDLKGLGESEIRGPYDARTLADELAALVLHEVDGRVDVVGHDWGGALALALARARPDLVRRLVILNAPYRELVVHRAPHVVGFALPFAPEVAFRLTGDRLIRAMLEAGWRSEPPLPPEVADHYAQAYAAPDRIAAMLGYYRAAARPAAARAVRSAVTKVSLAVARREPVRKPAPRHLSVERSLVIWGAADPVLPVSVGESVVRDLGANASMVTLPGVGHFAPEEAPGVVVPTIAAFLRAT